MILLSVLGATSGKVKEKGSLGHAMCNREICIATTFAPKNS